MKKLEDKLKTLPETYGCYLMKNINNEIIYVGKAINLKKRVNQYFVGAHDFKTTKLVSEIFDLETIIADSEKEALILEYNLIKKYDPKYNIIFRDDKSYPYILISNDKYFTVKTIRINNKKKIKGKLFGPYPNANAANKTTDLINKIFKTRKCKTLPKEVCIYYHLNQCPGYCIYDIDEEYVDDLKNNIIKFLNGDVSDIIKELIDKRDQASAELNFEYAKENQELIDSIKYVVDKQYVEINSKENIDVFNFYSADQYLIICILNIRGGKLLNRLISMNQIYNDVNDSVLSYLIQYYEKNIIPDQVIVPIKEIEDKLSNYFDNYVFKNIQRGRKFKLLKKAYENASEYYNQSKKMIVKESNYFDKVKIGFRSILGFEAKTIEIYDNSHLAGKLTVAGRVVYKDYKPYKKSYRRYRLDDSFDDLRSMHEVLYRRFYRALISEEQLPDLLIVDGAKTQINVAKKVLSKLNIDIKIMGLGKDEKHNTSYLMDENLNIINLDAYPELFMFLSLMQDEVHRYTISYNKLLRRKQLDHSILEDIKGVGEATSNKLMKHFKYLSAIKKAEVSDLNEVVSLKIAKNVYNYFRGKNARNI